MAAEDIVLRDISHVPQKHVTQQRGFEAGRDGHQEPPHAVDLAAMFHAEHVTSVRLVKRNQSQRERRKSKLDDVAAWRRSRERSSIG